MSRVRIAAEDAGHRAGYKALVVGAIGVVYGDIGTSPLYTLREAFGPAGGLHMSEPTVLGVLSLVFWSLIVIVTIKYVTLILRADNRGEGGVLAMSALALRCTGSSKRLRNIVRGLSIAGLALFYGDGLITPAISVLSAVEGLKTAQPGLHHYVLPIATAVLVMLFVIQRFGTGHVGKLFGPVMLVWFAVLALLGLGQIWQNPGVLAALNPVYAVELFSIARWQAFVALGAIVLAITGAEALYADMGHFGRSPIRVAWIGLVLPALVLNYFGQGALVLRDASALDNPFYRMAPPWLLWPLIGLATCATVIASQAVISGVYSLTRQAIQLDYLPRMTVRHTSATEMGQIYLPQVNWLLMVGVLLLVLGFRSSSNLAAAYGISVTGAMGIDAILAGIVAARLWGWPGALAGAVFGFFLLCDLGYFAANLLKIPHGGWFPLAMACLFSLIVMTWRRGRGVLYKRLYKDAMPVSLLHRETGPVDAAGGRHGGVHDRQSHRRAQPAAAQHQAQQGRARAGGADERGHRRHPLRPRQGAGRGRAAGQGLLPGPGTLRLSRRPRRAPGPGAVPRPWARDRPDDDELLPRPRDAGRQHPARARAGAGAAVHRAEHRRRVRDPLFRPAGGSRGRARHPDRDLTALPR